MDMSFLSCYYLKKPSCTATFKTTRNVNCFKNKLDFQARSRHVKLANFELAKKVCVLVGKAASIFGHIQFYTIPYILYFQKVPWQFRLAYLAKISGGKEVQRRLINTFGCISLALWKTIYANLLTILKKKNRIKCESCHRPKKENFCFWTRYWETKKIIKCLQMIFERNRIHISWFECQ